MNHSGLKGPTSSLGHFAIAIGLFLLGYWTFRPSAESPAAKEANSPPLTTAPNRATSAPYANEAEARADAARLYPDLAVPQSLFAQRYAAFEAQYRKEHPEFFRDPGWPVALAREAASKSDAMP